MHTERIRRSEAGFTLIEVLAAMMILSVGLLGLQALGIGAARSVALADRQTEVASIAIATIEARQQAIRNDPAGTVPGESCGTDDRTGINLCVTVENRTSAPALAAGSALVTVRANHPRMASDTFTVTSYVYNPALP